MGGPTFNRIIPQIGAEAVAVADNLMKALIAPMSFVKSQNMIRKKATTTTTTSREAPRILAVAPRILTVIPPRPPIILTVTLGES